MRFIEGKDSFRESPGIFRGLGDLGGSIEVVIVESNADGRRDITKPENRICFVLAVACRTRTCQWETGRISLKKVDALLVRSVK